MSTTSEEDFSPIKCDCCEDNIPGIGVECRECPTSVQLCCECFSLGAEIGPHKPHHGCRFFDCAGDVFLFPQDLIWTPKTNQRLLDAIETFGHGDLSSISNYVLNGGDNSDSKNVNVFKDPNTGKLSWPLCKSLTLTPDPQTFQLAENDPLLANLTSNSEKLEPLRITEEEEKKLACKHRVDYYDREYDNDAEDLVSNLKYNPEEDEIVLALQLAMVDMYTTRLRERARRKYIIRDFQLIEAFFKKKLKVKHAFSLFESHITEVLKPFAQLHSASKHSHILKNLVKEYELVIRIQEFCKYRMNGITRQSECADFDKFSSKRKPKLNMNGKTLSQNGSKLTHQKRKRRRLQLTRQKSHTASVLHRRLAHRVATSKVFVRKNGSKVSVSISQLRKTRQRRHSLLSKCSTSNDGL